MVSSINSNLLLNDNVKYNNVSVPKANYSTTAINKTEEKGDTFKSNLKSSLGFAALFEGIPLFNFVRRNKKLSGISTEAAKAIDIKNIEALKNIKHGEGKITERIANYINTTNESKKVFSELKSKTKQAHKAAKAGKQVAEEVVEQTAKETGKAASKIGLGGLKKSASEKLATKFPKLAPKASKLSKFMKSSGAGFMLIFSGATELLTEVVPTFKELGKEKGLKQLGKSAIKVVGDTAGFIGGEMIGTAIGTAAGTALLGTKIGATIGSVVPGAGTAIGAVVGMTCGMVGSFIAGKITHKITGDSEREIAKQIQEQNNPFTAVA